MKMMSIMINKINFNNLSRSKDLKINKKPKINCIKQEMMRT